MFSRHDLLFLTYAFDANPTTNVFSYRDFKSINYLTLYEDVMLIDWNAIFYMLEVDEQLEYLVYHIRYLYDKHVPQKTKTTSGNQDPWIDNEVEALMVQRDLAYARWKKFKISELQDEYKHLRNRVVSLTRHKKSLYYGSHFEEAVNTGHTWQRIRKIGIGRRLNIISSHLSPEELNNNFVNIPMTSPRYDVYTNMGNSVQTHLFEFLCVNQSEVWESTMGIKSNAIGPDVIDPKFFKIISPFLLTHVTHIFNTIILKSQFPKIWKQSKIIPLPKSGNQYRPIAILSYISKVFEHLINKQIRDHLLANSLLSNFQSGFRSDHSCLTALQKVSEDLRNNMDGNLISILVLLDHSKAFDSVDHDILCIKLDNFFNFSPHSTNLIKSYLSSRSQFVVIGTQQSKALNVSRGVPQGSILGPLLYSMYSRVMTF